MENDGSLTLEALAERYYAKGEYTRKAWTYMRSYERLLAHRRQEPLRLLELGVSSGASLLCWQDYLPNATIVGIDIDAPPSRILDQERIHFVQGSQDDPATLDRAAEVAGGSFDFIVDDASHIGYLTKRSFQYLFPRWLVRGGWYVIEDFGASFRPDFPDGRSFQEPDWQDDVPGAVEFLSSQHGMLGVIKQLVDHLMQDLMTGTRPYIAIERLIFEMNIVFVEKSMDLGASAPGLAKIEPQPSRIDLIAADLTALNETVRNQAIDLTTFQETVRNQADRIQQLERVIARMRRILLPLLWLRRSVGGTPKPD